MTERIRGTSPPRPGPACQVVRITSTTRQSFIILSQALFGTEIHWYANRSHECTASRGECERCQRNWPRKWKGYLHALALSDNARVFIELTPDASNKLLNHAPQDEPLRGLTVHIAKTPGGKKGRYIVEVAFGRRDVVQLPPEEDPLPILRYLWNVKNPSGGNHP